MTIMETIDRIVVLLTWALIPINMGGMFLYAARLDPFILVPVGGFVANLIVLKLDKETRR